MELMRQAFKPAVGPLAKADSHRGQESLMSLFSGAIRSYKNPHSHRTVVMNDPADALEIVMLASLLLRIIEDQSTCASKIGINKLAGDD